ncbi:hypothetical protein B0F90DRAFT_583530 [Multifurca ochricompacta]|uniref:Uncharacterized protein n=1 Tax=Multifurca ochricompacta TaxID=376703 RepID=A0AAD4M2S1_9AGAM|nr:hypothetical protein B0F90DRAFT_583530 [Multifurca ochricompacta]
MSMYDQPATYRNRRPSFSSGPSFGAGQGFPPYNDPFRPGRDGFNDRGQFSDPYNAGGYPEVSGPPPGPPPPRMPSGPQNGPVPNAPPPLVSQPFPPNGGFGSFPPPGAMGTSYSMSTREQRPSPPFEPPSGFEPTGAPPPRAAAAYPDSYDNSPLSDNYFPPPIDDGFGAADARLAPVAVLVPPRCCLRHRR